MGRGGHVALAAPHDASRDTLLKSTTYEHGLPAATADLVYTIHTVFTTTGLWARTARVVGTSNNAEISVRSQRILYLGA
jgi:hypothetical protein